MISAKMRDYDYYLYQDKDSYGQATLSEEVQGKTRMAIYVTSKSVQDNINYENANYIGLTHDKLSNKHVIRYGEEKLKVLYVIDAGGSHYKQVFMARV